MPKHIIDHADIFICPACEGGLEIVNDGIRCLKCRHHYEVEDGIPLLFWPNEWGVSSKDVTDIVKSFYEKNPFPNYEDIEDTGDIIEKARRSIFARLLNEQVPFNIRVLEVGCGTGQLSNFLGIAQRFVFGTDICLNSLRLAHNFKEKNGLERVGFYQMNLFRPIFKEESFPLVICNGVLHHTSDPFLGFKTISKLVKRGGYIITGLYNKYGRIPVDIQRIIFKLKGGKFFLFDNQLKKEGTGDVKKTAWFLDQYKNPHESRHTIGEALKWFDQTGFDFINSIPKLKASEGFTESERLFKQAPKGGPLDHFSVQARMLFRGYREGGLFLLIGRRR